MCSQSNPENPEIHHNRGRANHRRPGRITTSLLAAVLAGLLLSSPAEVKAQEGFEEARSTLEQWVRTRQLISQTRADWRVERESIRQRIELIEQEIGMLDEQIEDMEEGATVADRQRDELNEQNERLRRAVSVVREEVQKMENQLRAASVRFPEPLSQRIEPLFRRIPEGDRAGAVSLSERMQNVVGILNEVDRFNATVTMASELRPIPTGERAEVRTLYLGLARAYFVDATGQFAGYGKPGAEGWEWEPVPEIAREVARAVAIYNNERPAEFVRLPVIIE